MGPLDMAAAHAGALLRTVESEIIPRLMMLHRQGPGAGPRAPALMPALRDAGLDDADVEAFTEQLLKGHDAARSFLTAKLDGGTSVPSLCLSLLAPSARRLGEMWSDDLCDFAQVTIALGRLQGLLRGLAVGLPNFADAGPAGRSALFAAAPGEQHTLGLAMVRDFFRASGWDVWNQTPDDPQALLDLLRTSRFDLLGLSIGSERHADALAGLIARARVVSMNPRLRVLAGGPLLLLQPELASRLGADGTADDARHAILVADKLLTA
jgi:methanogenic corrinoid protein MtbC1